MRIPIHYEVPNGYVRIHAATDPELAMKYADLLLRSGRTVCFVRFPGFKLAVYAKA
jgi:hypothetical protein